MLLAAGADFELPDRNGAHPATVSVLVEDFDTAMVLGRKWVAAGKKRPPCENVLGYFEDNGPSYLS
jgi:hypothetical protein